MARGRKPPPCPPGPAGRAGAVGANGTVIRFVDLECRQLRTVACEENERILSTYAISREAPSVSTRTTELPSAHSAKVLRTRSSSPASRNKAVTRRTALWSSIQRAPPHDLGIPVPNEVTRCTVPWECLGDLRETHSAVGFAVTPNDTHSRRPWRRMTRQ